MKNIFAVLIIIISSSFFYSCSESTITSPGQPESVEWQIIDSIGPAQITNISIVDENNIYLSSNNQGYKINNGVRTDINFESIWFLPGAVDTYSADYYVFGGRSSSPINNTEIKIFNGGNLTTVMLEEKEGHGVSAINILQPGKILAASSTTLYLFDSGIVTPIAVDGHVYKIVNQGGRIYLAATTLSGTGQLIYKFENNTPILLDTRADYEARMATDDALIRMHNEASGTDLFYWGSTGWAPLFSDPVNREYYWCIGENLQYIYFFTADSSGNQGMLWNGTKLFEDINYPLQHITFPSSVSNMRSNTFFISQYYNGKSYIYKGKRKL